MSAPTDSEKNRFSARARRYAKVGTKVGGAQVSDGADSVGNGTPQPEAEVERTDEVTPAPDIAENEGVAPTSPKRPSKPRNRNRRHGRRR